MYIKTVILIDWCLNLTVLCLKVSKAQLRAIVGDENFSIQSEDHGLVLHIDHTPDHITLAPAATKDTTSPVHTSTLRTAPHKQTNQIRLTCKLPY